jgi:hypothetical protein
MNVLRLKKSIVNMVAPMEKPTELTPKQEMELDEAIQQTYDPTQLVPHDEVIKTMRLWIKK